VFDPPTDQAELIRLRCMDFTVFQDIDKKYPQMTHPEFQRISLEYGLRWIKENPGKFMRLNSNNMIALFRPGVSRTHYSTKVWLLSLLICTPVFGLAYLGVFLNLRLDFRIHSWILGVFCSLLIFSLVFYNQNRFRAITIEQFYLLYFAFMVNKIIAIVQKTCFSNNKTLDTSEQSVPK